MRNRHRFAPVGLVACVLLMSHASAAHAQRFELLNSFAGCAPAGCGTTGDAAHPYAVDTFTAIPDGPLVSGPDGNLYGTSGPDHREGETAPRSWGTIYRISPGGSRAVVYHFNGQEPGGCGPGGIGFNAGVLYGVGRRCSSSGTGTIFRLANGIPETLQEFPTPGFQPYTLVVTSIGTFYLWGADHSAASGDSNLGNYRWNGTDGTVTWLGSHSPRMVPAADGHVFATVAFHQQYPAVGSYGWVVRLDDGVRIYDFTSPDNIAPDDNLVVGLDGNLYGSAAQYPFGFPSDSFRKPYRLTPGGTLTYISDQGMFPIGTGPDGSIYGRVDSHEFGEVRRITNGIVIVVHNFEGTDGRGTFSPLALGADGHLYGVRSDGGAHGLGVLYTIRTAGVDVKANGSDGPIELGPGEPLRISMAFEAPAFDVNPAEVYIAVVTPALQIFWATGVGFSASPSPPLYGGPLQTFAATTLIDIPDAAILPDGDYYWVVIVDADRNRVANGTYVDVVKTTRRSASIAAQRPR